MGLSEVIASHPLLATGLLMAAVVFFAYRTRARRRMPTVVLAKRREEERSRQFTLSVPIPLAQFHSQLRDLADEMDEVFPRKFRLIDQLILDSDREIARLQRRLVAGGPISASVSRREPDLFLLEEAEPNRNAAEPVLRFDNRRIRRAA